MSHGEELSGSFRKLALVAQQAGVKHSQVRVLRCGGQNQSGQRLGFGRLFFPRVGLRQRLGISLWGGSDEIEDSLAVELDGLGLAAAASFAWSSKYPDTTPARVFGIRTSTT